MPIQDVKVISIPVADQERAKAFYTEQLGFELVRDDTSVPGMRWIQVAPKSGGAALTLVTWFETMPPGSVRGLVLTSDDLDGDYRRLVATGVEFDGPPEHRGYATEAVLRDPDGNQLVLHQRD